MNFVAKTLDMLKEHVLSTKINFITKSCFTNKYISSLKLFDMFKKYVLATKINFVTQNSFSGEIYSSLKLFDMSKKMYWNKNKFHC